MIKKNLIREKIKKSKEAKKIKLEIYGGPSRPNTF